MARAHIGLGSNLGDKEHMVGAALERLDAAEGVRVVARSPNYRTPPWGETNQDWFVNAAAAVETTLGPHALLDLCLEVERQLGRVRERKWGPRLIDIDLLDYDGRAVSDELLTLPHPFVLERAFVLKPLADIAPDLTIGGIRVSEALAQVDQTGIDRIAPSRQLIDADERPS
jgi:2-amino-4-hydroxy-6-hydroxymethyldihydropteridine diphosphokinase